MLQWCDNFGSYGNVVADMLNGAYAQMDNCALIANPDGSGDTVLQIQQGFFANGIMRKVLDAAVTTAGIAYRMWCDSLPNNVGRLFSLFEFRNVLNQTICSVRIETDGRISAYRGSAGTGVLLGTSAAPAIVAGAWQHIECKVLADAAVGTVEVRVEGVTVLQLANVNTLGNANPITQIAIEDVSNGGAAVPYLSIKDLLIWDTTGANNKDFMGTCFVLRLAVDGDVALNWNTTGVNGFGQMNETPPNDAGYVSAVSPPPPASLFSFQDLPANVSAVKALMPLIRSTKSDGGDGNLQVSLKSVAAFAAGANRPITVTPTFWKDVLELDPNGGIAWTRISANAAQLQLNRTV